MTQSTKESADFRSRLYASYSSGQVGINSQQLQNAVQARAPYLKQLFAKWVPADRSTRIFDLGCGFGAMLYVLKQMGYTSLAGVDVSPEQVHFAHELGLENVTEGTIHEGLRRLPESNVDVLIAFDVLEHLTRPELLEIGDLIYRALAPQGKLIVHVPNAAGIFSGAIRYGDLTHELAFTPKSLTQFGNACGLKLVALQEDVPVAHGVVSLMRKLIWQVGTIPMRLLMLAENPDARGKVVLSQNMLAVFKKA